MQFNYFLDTHILNIFFQKSYGKAMLACEFLIVGILQFDVVDGNFYGKRPVNPS